LLPVPSEESLQFCSNNTQLEDFFQDLSDSVEHVLIILAVVILLAAILAMIPHGVLEWWSWRKLKCQARTAEHTLRSMENKDFLEILHILRSPITRKISASVAARFASEKQKALIHWFFAYISHPPALLVLAISIATFVCCLFQIIILNELRKGVPALLTDVGNVEAMISSKIQNASAVWINGTNQQISNVELEINDNLLGWARESTQSLNNTLNTCTIFIVNANLSQWLTLP
jgi:hypothetical protein